MKQVLSSLLLLLLAAQLCMIASSSDVVTENLKLYVDGNEFFIKAICYSPAPLGQGVMNKNGEIGGGYCSPKVSPFGSTVTTCYDSDYFDGGGNAAGKDQPADGWFQATWRRDFPIMKSLGANTLRMYSANPTTKQASIYYPEVVPLPLGKDHVPFMDMAHEYGFKVIFPLIGDYGMMTEYSETTFKRLLRWQIDELGGHPALLMWGFGNELPLDGNQFLVDKLNTYIAYIKQYTLTKWGRKVPVTTAVVDLPSSYDNLAATLDVDVFTTNAGYRGFTFTDLWAGNSMNQGWHKLSCRYNKPVFIGEINWHSLENAITYSNPDWFNQIWKDLVDHIDQGCIGGAFFEYSDERLKADPLQQTMGLVKFEVDTTGGVPSTEVNAWNPDIARPKEIIFDAVKSGSYKGKFYNMNSSPFYLIGRPQSTLGNSASVCSAFSLIECPAKNTCSFNGRCDRQQGKCTCNKGWSGADCSQAVCESGCSGRGTCVGIVSPPVCNCQPGWGGPACSVQVTQANCANNCAEGNGRCDSTGKCVCFKGWWGHNCAIPDTSYPPLPNATVVPTAAPTQKPTNPPTTTTVPPTTTTVPPTTTAVPSTTTQAPTATPTTQKATTTTPPPTSAPTTTKQPTTTTTKQPTTTKKPTTTTTKKPASTTTVKPTAAPTTTTTVKPATTTTKPTTAPSTTAAPTTAAPTQPPSAACGELQACGQACFNPQYYTCFDGFLCGKPTQRCGNACYDTALYKCNNNQIVPL